MKKMSVVHAQWKVLQLKNTTVIKKQIKKKKNCSWWTMKGRAAQKQERNRQAVHLNPVYSLHFAKAILTLGDGLRDN